MFWRDCLKALVLFDFVEAVLLFICAEFVGIHKRVIYKV